MPKSSKPSIAGVPKAIAPEPKRSRLRNTGTRHLKTDKNPYQLPKARSIAEQALIVLWRQRLLFGGIVVIYLFLTLLLVRNFTGTTDIASLKSLLSVDTSKLTGGLGAFAAIVSTSGNSTSPLAGIYRVILIVTTSLAIIWALRQVIAGPSPGVRIRDAYYKGMYPLVPVLLVLLVITVQLLPFLIGAGLYSFIVTNGIAAHPVEQLLWGLLAVAGLVASCYWLISSIFALYIVALPDMTPLKGLRSARLLVKHRRWVVLRKLLFLPLALSVIALIIGLPFVLLITSAAPLVLFFLGVLYLPLVHAYLYTLYRELLK